MTTRTRAKKPAYVQLGDKPGQVRHGTVWSVLKVSDDGRSMSLTCEHGGTETHIDPQPGMTWDEAKAKSDIGKTVTVAIDWLRITHSATERCDCALRMVMEPLGAVAQ